MIMARIAQVNLSKLLNLFSQFMLVTQLNLQKEDLRLIIKDIELKILHEIAHHVLSHADKYSNGTAIKEIEAESDAFGMNILKVLDSDILVCQNENLVPRQISFPYAADFV